MIHLFIHSGYFYSAPSSPLLLRGAHDYSKDTVPEFHAEAPQATAVKDLPKCPRSLRGGYSGNQTHDPPVESHRLNQYATTSHSDSEKCTPLRVFVHTGRSNDHSSYALKLGEAIVVVNDFYKILILTDKKIRIFV